MAQSTKAKKPGKAVPKPSLPPHYPLRLHDSGRIFKWIRGGFHYFGRWANVKNGKLTPVDDIEAALQQAADLYDLQRNDLQAGRKPRNPDDDGPTVGKLCYEFMASRNVRREAGELSVRSYRDYDLISEKIIAEFGDNRLLSDLRPEDFRQFRETLAKGRGPVSLANDITRARVVFKFAYDNGLIEAPLRLGADFKRPSAKTIRIARSANGPRMIEADELRLILDALTGNEVISRRIAQKSGKPVKVTLKANPALRAMVLLGINAGFGQSDLANLPLSALDLSSGWVNFPRPKTGIGRRCPLWPETVAALREALAKRPQAKDTEDADCAFLTQHGRRWVRPGKAAKAWIDSVGLEFGKVLTALGLKRARLGFYAIRHTFQTIGEASKDSVAVAAIMGHADASMSATYRERIDDSRLRDVTECVRAWLFPKTNAKPVSKAK